jgi:hypothetical protein
MARFVDLKFKIDLSPLIAKTRRQELEIKLLPQRALDYFILKTPVDTGYARGHTSLQGNKIHAFYPYAEKLDSGHSPQAPNGMVTPTEEWLKQEFKKIFRK